MEQTNRNGQQAIHHRVEIEAPPQRVYRALCAQRGLSQWWTTDVSADARVGGTIRFGFGKGTHHADMRVEELVADRSVIWRCVAGPWEGMHFRFGIAPHERGAVLVLTNDGWPAQDDFYGHCNAKWGFFLAVSLKNYLETAEGVPHPHEPKI